MALSRGLRQQQAANAHAAELEEFTAMLLEVLEDPEVGQAIRDIVRSGKALTRSRRGGPPVASASAAQRLKTDRLAARGRPRRG